MEMELVQKISELQDEIKKIIRSEFEEKKAKIEKINKKQEFLQEKTVRVVIKLMEEKKLNLDDSDLQETLLQTLKIMFSPKRT